VLAASVVSVCTGGGASVRAILLTVCAVSVCASVGVPAGAAGGTSATPG